MKQPVAFETKNLNFSDSHFVHECRLVVCVLIHHCEHDMQLINIELCHKMVQNGYLNAYCDSNINHLQFLKCDTYSLLSNICFTLSV